MKSILTTFIVLFSILAGQAMALGPSSIVIQKVWLPARGTYNYAQNPLATSNLATGTHIVVKHDPSCQIGISEAAFYTRTKAGALTRLQTVVPITTVAPPPGTEQYGIWVGKDWLGAYVNEIGFNLTTEKPCLVTITQALSKDLDHVLTSEKVELSACGKLDICTAAVDPNILFCSATNEKTGTFITAQASSNACTTANKLKEGLCQTKKTIEGENVVCVSKEPK